MSLRFPLQPERINPELNQKGYNVKSDVWSLGITMVWLGLGPALTGQVRLGWGWAWGRELLGVCQIVQVLGKSVGFRI